MEEDAGDLWGSASAWEVIDLHGAFWVRDVSLVSP